MALREGCQGVGTDGAMEKHQHPWAQGFEAALDREGGCLDDCSGLEYEVQAGRRWAARLTRPVLL